MVKWYSNGHIEEKNESKYLVFDSTDENKEVLKKYTELWNGIKNEIETINGGKKGEYGKDSMKIKFNTDDNLTLNKQLKLHILTLIIRSVFEEDGNLYRQDFLDDALYELLQYEKIDVSERIDTNKTSGSKECMVCHY